MTGNPDGWPPRRRFLKRAAQALLASGTLPLLSSCTLNQFEAWVNVLIAQPNKTLADLINNYRAQNGLPKIPIGAKLTRVAASHFLDLACYHADVDCAALGQQLMGKAQTQAEKDYANGFILYDLHSWSKEKGWTPPQPAWWKGGPYNGKDSGTWPIMWDKPKEISNYPDHGYEIAAGCDDAEQAIGLWKGDAPHSDVILERGIWAGFGWKALGAFAGRGFACAWFGRIEEPK